MNLAALTKRELVTLSRHLGLYRGDSERVGKRYFEDLLAAHDDGELCDAMSNLGIEIPAMGAAAQDGDAFSTKDGGIVFTKVDRAKAPTVAAVASHGADPATAMAQALAAMMANAVSPDMVRGMVDDAIQAHGGTDEATVRSIVTGEIERSMEVIGSVVEKAIAAIRLPVTVRIQEADQTVRDLDGYQHRNFPRLLKACTARDPSGHRLNVWLAGPAGTGKTTAARNVAKALNLAFYAVGTSDNKYEVTGFTDANGRIVDTAFKAAYRDGGVILLDEVDGWFPNALLALNAATANGVALFPDGMIPRHNDCVIICAANTYGQGGVTEYVGRMKQDAAFLDRFVKIAWPIDEDLELALSGNPEWCKRVQKLRKAAADKGLKVLITPRATIYGASLIAAGFTMDEAAEMTIRNGMTDEQWRSIGGASC